MSVIFYLERIWGSNKDVTGKFNYLGIDVWVEGYLTWLEKLFIPCLKHINCGH